MTGRWPGLAAATLAAEPGAAEVRRRIERMRLEAGLLRRAELEAWLALREVDGAWLERQARDALAVEAMAAAERAAAGAPLPR